MIKKVTVLFACLSMAACSAIEIINRQKVEEVVARLSSDDMQGRGVFSPGIDLAAKYIGEQFKIAGLEPINGLVDFNQKFTMYQLNVIELDVIINSEVVAIENIIAFPDQEQLHWQSIHDASISYISDVDDFRTKIGELTSSTEDKLVIVDKVHSALFNRYRAYYGSLSQKINLGKANNVVAVLIDAKEVEAFDVKVNCDLVKKPLANVVGQLPGKRSNEFVLFSAHYDHLGIVGEVNGDSIANGANDDASGVTAVIMLAKYLKSLGTPERSILFAAFTAEESGGYGSKYYSQQLNPDEIVAMFNIEMIGKPATNGSNSAWVTGWDKSSFGEILQKTTENTKYEFYSDPYPNLNLFYRSDNATLARLGVPAHSISTTPIDVDKDYHTVTDELSTLNLDHLTNTIKAIAAGGEKIISGEMTPTRVDPTTIR